jgi:hypothetical protein
MLQLVSWLGRRFQIVWRLCRRSACKMTLASHHKPTKRGGGVVGEALSINLWMILSTASPRQRVARRKMDRRRDEPA